MEIMKKKKKDFRIMMQSSVVGYATSDHQRILFLMATTKEN